MLFGRQGASEEELDRRAREAAAAATLAADVATMKARLEEALVELRGRDERYFDLAAKLNNLCESGHRRISALEKHAEETRAELAARVQFKQLESKFEMLFGVDCTKEDHRDKSRATFKQMQKVDFDRLGDMLALDPEKIKSTIVRADEIQTLREAGRRRLVNWILGLCGAAMTAGLTWLASGFRLPPH